MARPKLPKKIPKGKTSPKKSGLEGQRYSLFDSMSATKTEQTSNIVKKVTEIQEKAFQRNEDDQNMIEEISENVVSEETKKPKDWFTSFKNLCNSDQIL